MKPKLGIFSNFDRPLTVELVIQRCQIESLILLLKHHHPIY